MKKITKKAFVETLAQYETAFIVTKFDWSDEKCIALMEKINQSHKEQFEYRTIKKVRSNDVIFSNGSHLYFSDEGDKRYFTYKNENGILFVIMTTETYDSWEERNTKHYLVYLIKTDQES